ncbi:hypothetical protein B7494_g1378 [Chlorociboria aeruginascens]|nr:hypothetical protein B7494_g1378 [Chlorociboria aeruginascens]
MASASQTSEKRQAQFDLGITLSLFFWPSLSLAVTNNWGGPDSADKREWFAQTVVDLIKENEADVDIEWVETLLLQVMIDEFEVVVGDDSAFEIAEQIMRLRKDCARGEFAEVQEMNERWNARGGGEDRAKAMFREVDRNEREDETDGSEDDEDVDMDEAPQLVRTREPAVPEVDEDGFTKVTKKKR